MKGTLYLIPNALGAGDARALEHVLPGPVRAQAAQLDYFIAENAKSARAFLKRLGTERPLQGIEIRELNVHTPDTAIAGLLQPLLTGRNAGLLSEAGCPAVADPGALLVRHAHRLTLTVAPLVGPSALLLALMASGLNGQSFAFHGYLPVDAVQRGKRLRELEQQSRRAQQTQLFIETPYRNRSLLETLLTQCAPTTLLSIAVDLTLPTEQIITRPIAEWRLDTLELHKCPALFSILA